MSIYSNSKINYKLTFFYHFISFIFVSLSYRYKIQDAMKRPMIEYTKMILSKVSFDSNLFCKEVSKAINNLLPYEIEELKVWLEAYTKNKPELKDSLVHIEKI